MKPRALSLVFLVMLCGAVAYGQAIAHIALPASLTGTLDGVDFKIRVPANWNGTLLVFAHGVQFGTLTPEIAPMASPAATPSLEEQLLTLGYALAGSGFENFDKNGVQHSVGLTAYFREVVGTPSRTIIWGNSLGSGIALKLIEKFPHIYDGAIANCSQDTGTPEQMDAALAFGLAYAAAFGWHEAAWGTLEDLRPGVNASADVLPLMRQDGAFPPPFMPGTVGYGKWEFVRLVMHMDPQAFWGKDPQQPYMFFVLQMWKATERRAAVDAENGGRVAQNQDHDYSLTDAEQQYLVSIGVPLSEITAMLDYMKSHANITADPVARRHAGHWGALGGQLQRPVLTMHATLDGLVFVSGESNYTALVEAAGASDSLVQVYVNTVGHCRFTAEQYLTAVATTNSWIETGVRPDASAFPATKNFVPGFAPPAWVF